MTWHSNLNIKHHQVLQAQYSSNKISTAPKVAQWRATTDRQSFQRRPYVGAEDGRIPTEIRRTNMPLENHSSVYCVTSFLLRQQKTKQGLWLPCVAVCGFVRGCGHGHIQESDRKY